jgi:hypothetical protein
MFNIIGLILLIMVVPMLIFAPWLPTRKRDINRVLSESSFKKEDVVYDLGSWDGKVLFWLADKIDSKLVWIESFLPLYLFCVIKKLLYYRNKDIHFKFWDFFFYDLSEATHIYVFWLDWKMDRLAKKIETDCKIWTEIISYTFTFPTWKPIKIDKPNKDELSIFFYKL